MARRKTKVPARFEVVRSFDIDGRVHAVRAQLTADEFPSERMREGLLALGYLRPIVPEEGADAAD